GGRFLLSRTHVLSDAHHRKRGAERMGLFHGWTDRVSFPVTVFVVCLEQVLHHGSGRVVRVRIGQAEGPQAVPDSHGPATNALTLAEPLDVTQERVSRELRLRLQ